MSELFKIESQQPPAVEMICGNCVHYKPFVDTETKRVHPSKAGQCVWKAEINWPLSIRRFSYQRDQDPTFHKVQVYKDTNAKECKCFTAKKK